MTKTKHEPSEDHRMPLSSADVLGERIQGLRELFPEAFAEGKADLKALRTALGHHVEDGRERYGLSWAGKAEAMRVIQVPSVGTLIPAIEDSINFETAENVFIEGDNLEVLKLLQKSYYGKVKLIYIDPPYNTGHEFIYPDNFREGLQDYLRYSGQVDAEGLKLSTNTETSGRFHSKWLNMMWPRLFVARNLLSEDGVIAVSIDDNELHNLRHLLDEIFGQENFVAVFAWQKKDTPANDAKGISVTHEYVVMYRRSDLFFRNLLPRSEDQLANYKNPDNDPRGPWTRTSLIRKEVREGRCFPIKNPSGRERVPPPGTSWRIPPEKFARYESENRLWWGQDSDGDLPFLKRFLSEVQDGVVPITWWDYEFAGSNRNGKMEIRDLFDGQVPFETPKPVLLIKRLLDIATEPDDLVLDFFAGSGTTGDAVMRKNAEDGGNRRYILVQLPEPIDGSPYKTLADVCKDRLRRVGRKLSAGSNGQGELPVAAAPQVAVGFKVFKLSSSNFKIWDGDSVPRDPDALMSQIRLFADNLIPGRTRDAILYELILKAGLPLTARVEPRSVDGSSIYSVADGLLLICLEDPLKRELLREMAKLGPQRVLCLDHAFRGNDKDKVNALLEMRSHGIEFRTV